MSNPNFYNDLDLRYPEIAICIDKIDRTNPGVCNFYIPILTPNLDTTSLKKKEEIIRLDNSIIANQDSLSISNIKIQNYIPIEVPKELCAFVGGPFNVTNIGDIEFEETLNIIPTDDNRYIKEGSKWIVVFIGGDIGKPQIIAPYREPVV